MAKEGFSSIVVGLDYGDEGKGRITDQRLASGNYQIVVRFNGGNNAGHSIELPDKELLKLNSVPSGVLNDGIMNYIGSGCVVDPVHLIDEEFPKIEKIVRLDGRLKISALASAITPIHIHWDKVSGKSIGTTGKGIGPAYADKARRAEFDLLRNIRIGHIITNPQEVRNLLLQHFHSIPLHLRSEISEDEIKSRIEKFIVAAEELKKRGFIEIDPLWLTREVQSGKNVLMEGAQAHGLDITHGVPPFTTSSQTIAGNAYVGGDLSPRYHHKTFGVSKLICSRVGAGPFVGEFGNKQSEDYCAEKNDDGKPRWNNEFEKNFYQKHLDELKNSSDPFEFGIYLRIKTAEYGATTGRPRRIGMIDLVRLRNACAINGVDELYLTKADCLENYQGNQFLDGKLPVITGYELDGQTIDHIPSTADQLYRVKPVITKMEVPSGEIDSVLLSKISQFDEHWREATPKAMGALVNKIQEFTATKVAGIGIGPGREEMVYL